MQSNRQESQSKDQGPAPLSDDQQRQYDLLNDRYKLNWSKASIANFFRRMEVLTPKELDKAIDEVLFRDRTFPQFSKFIEVVKGTDRERAQGTRKASHGGLPQAAVAGVVPDERASFFADYDGRPNTWDHTLSWHTARLKAKVSVSSLSPEALKEAFDEAAELGVDFGAIGLTENDLMRLATMTVEESEAIARDESTSKRIRGLAGSMLSESMGGLFKKGAA